MDIVESYMPFLVPLFILGYIVSLAMIGGWWDLSRKYRAKKVPAEGTVFQFQTGRMGISNYSWMLNFQVSPQGLYLEMFFPMRPGHPPLLIPWNELRKGEDKSNVLGRFVEFTIGEPRLTSLRVPGPVADAITPFLPQ